MLEIIIFTILISTLLNLFLRQFRIPTIIGYIATGTVIAYGFDLHDAIHNEELKEIAEFGVVFLMFTIGLEFSVKHLLKMKKEVFLYGGLQVILSAAFFTLISNYFFHIEIKSAIIIGSALALSSTAIVLKLLNESGNINKVYGRKVLGVLLFQDIAVIPILLMITLFSIKDESVSVSSLLFLTFIKAIALIVGLFMAGKYLLEPFFHEVSKTKSNEIFISSILLIVIGSSFLAHQLGFSYSLGAFIAGMMISETRYKYQVEADLIPFRDLLLGVFFITVGMQLDFRTIYENIFTISLLLPALIIIKMAFIFGIIRFATNKRNAVKSALALFQLGEFALVIFELSFARGLLNPELGQILIITVVISMIMTPFVLRNISQIADFLIKEKEPKDHNDTIYKQNFTDHIVLIGFGRLGKHISKLIQKEGLKFVAIEHDIQTVQKAQKQGLPVIFGNAAQNNILESVNIKDASAVIISLGNSQKLNHVCEVVNEMTHNVKTIVKVNNLEDKALLSDLNLTHIIVETEKTAAAMFKEIKEVDIT